VLGLGCVQEGLYREKHTLLQKYYNCKKCINVKVGLGCVLGVIRCVVVDR